LTSNYDDFDFTLVKGPTQTGFPWNPAGDDIIQNVVSQGAAGSTTATADKIALAISQMIQCGHQAISGCKDPNEVYLDEAGNVVNALLDQWGNPLVYISCSAYGYANNYAIVYSVGADGVDTISGGALEGALCDYIINGGVKPSIGDDIYSPITPSSPGNMPVISFKKSLA